MSTGFTDLADELVRSGNVRSDRALTYHLTLATRRFVELARLASQQPVPESGPTEASFTGIHATPALLLPAGHTSRAAIEGTLSVGASSLSWQHHQPLPIFYDAVFVSHDPLRDEQALGASSLMQPLGTIPTTSPPFSVESAAVQYPLGSRLLLYTLEFVYFSLLGWDNYAPDLASQIFRLTLAKYTRPQILSGIRWYLGPGYSYTVSLGALFHESFESHGLSESILAKKSSLHPISSRDTWTFGDAIFPVKQSREREEYLSAFEVEEYLKSRAHSEIDGDTLRININASHHLPASRCHESLSASTLHSPPPDKDDTIISTDTSHSNVPISNLDRCDLPSSASNSNLHTAQSTAGYSRVERADRPLTSDGVCGNQEEGVRTPLRGATVNRVPITRPRQPRHDLLIAIDIKSFMRRLSTASTCLTHGPGYPRSKIDQLILDSAVL
jgi:hypothetical protein